MVAQLKYIYDTLRDDRSTQVMFIVFGVVFIGFFAVSEADGLVTFAEVLFDALQSAPDFIEKIVNYFKDVPGGPLRRSALAGSIFGAGATGIFCLTARGFLRLPAPGMGAGLTAIVLGAFIQFTAASLGNALAVGIFVTGLAAYFYDEIQDFLIAETYIGPGSLLERFNRLPRALWLGILAFGLTLAVPQDFWNALAVIMVMAFIVSLIYEKETRAFFALDTLKRLVQRDALLTLALGLGTGVVIGAISAQILNYPLKHCTFAPEIDRQQYHLGLGVTAFSTLILLVPTWTLLTRRQRQGTGDTVGYFRNGWIAYLLLLPSLLFLAVFLYYPSLQVLTESLLRSRRGAPRKAEYCLQNYLDLSESKVYHTSFSATLWITVAIVAFTMIAALGIAVLASQKVRGASLYRTLLIWPYAVSPVVMGTIFLNMFRKDDIGIINWLAGELFNTQPNWLQDATLAPWVIILAAVWNGLGFNILFYVAGLQNIPRDLLEAAAIDGANRLQRFFRITLPLLSPFTFFLLVANVTYSFYGIYGIIDILTQGGPPLGLAGADGSATSVLIYQAYQGAFEANARVGEASAQAVVLFLLVAAITLVQFRFVERRVTYGG
jgi:sn-glycerol 3-phosphate transport system permease protein